MMAEETKPADDANPDAHEEYQRAKKGVIDAGHIVTSAGDEPIRGTIGDITDGDSHTHHPHHHDKK
jgi:hypothetical protein